MQKLAIIGGSYLQLPLVRKAKELGIETHCFAWADGAVCKNEADFFYPISITEKETILEICKNIKIDGVTTIASDLAVLTVTYIASEMKLVGNPVEYAEITTNKFKMRENFLKYSIPSPKFTEVGVSGAYDINDFNYPLIVKPTDRSGSRGVEKVDSPDMLKSAIHRALKESFSKTAIIEEFIEGKEISVESISYKGRHYILQITDKVTTGAPYFVELEHHQPSSLPQQTQEKVRKIVLKALDSLHIQFGASHSELKVTESGDIKVIEIGARMGGDFIGSHLVQLSTGYDFLKAVIMVALGEEIHPQITQHCCSGVYFLCKETLPRTQQIIADHRRYPEIVEAEVTNAEIRNVECSGDRSGYIIYQSNKKFII